MTSYVVLELGTTDALDVSRFEPWHVADTIEATSGDAAIRAISKAGRFVAIPTRSWNPVDVTLETKTVVRFNADAAE